MPLTGDQLVKLVEQLPAVLTALAALIAALRAHRKAHDAQRTADDAIEQAKEAAREQIHFALRDAARRDRAATSPIPLPREEGGGHA
jgi:hypothetical protein